MKRTIKRVNSAPVRRCVTVGGNKIVYTLTRKDVKNINLRIKPDGSVSVSAHFSASDKYIDDIVRKRSDFILAHLKSFEQKASHDAGGEYKDGDVFYLMGKPLTLRVLPSNREHVDVTEDNIVILTRTPGDALRKKYMLEVFFHNKCVDVFPLMLSRIGANFKFTPALKLRTMKSRWGSCIPAKKQITLNKRLIHMPSECIESVIVHEMCHFKHPNHSKAFYDHMAEFLPDHKRLRKLVNDWSDKANI